MNHKAVQAATSDLVNGKDIEGVTTESSNDVSDIEVASTIQIEDKTAQPIEEVNTDGWEENDVQMDPMADTPFMVRHQVTDAALTKEQREDMDNDEIMNIYQQKYGKKTIFDNLWAQDHPEEAKKIKEKSLVQIPPVKNETLVKAPVVKNETKPALTLAKNETKKGGLLKLKEIEAAETKAALKAAQEKKLSPEEQYKKLVEDANRQDPWKEPIKDLIDQYADVADKNAKDKEMAAIMKVQEKMGVKTRNNFGNEKVKQDNKTQNATK